MFRKYFVKLDGNKISSHFIPQSDLSCILQNMSYIVKKLSVLLSLCTILIFLSQTLGVVVYHWLVVRSAYMDIRETPVLPVYVDDDTKIEKAGGKYIRM